MTQSANSQFLPVNIKPAEIFEGDNGPLTLVSGNEVIVVDTIFDVRLVQPGHVKKNKELKNYIGQFYYPDLELSVEKLRLLPISIIGRGRRLYPPYDSGDNQLLCYSHDGLVPAGKVESPFSDRCAMITEKGRYEALCEKAKWIGGTPPDCGDQLSLALYDIDKKLPIRMQLSGTGISAWNKFNKELKKQRNIARIKGKKVADHILEVTGELEGTYCRPIFSYVEAPDENPGAYAPLLEWYLRNVVPVIASKEQEETDKEAGSGASSESSAPISDTEQAKEAEAAAEAQGFSV